MPQLYSLRRRNYSPLDISTWRKKYVKENAVYMRALRIDLNGDTTRPCTSGTLASGLVGSWELNLTPSEGKAPKVISGLATFTSDGTDTGETAPMPVSAQLDTGRKRAAVFGTPGHGIWQPGPAFDSLFISFTSLFTNPDTTLRSKRTVTMTVSLNSTGDHFVGGYSFVVLEPTGHAIMTGSGTVRRN